jgi:AraC-like DNA-binding protein
MILQRDPRPALRPFVKTLWAADHSALPLSGAAGRERVLPTGDMHIAFRLSDHPVCLFDGLEDTDGRTLGHAVLGGARAAFYLRDKPASVRSVGAQLRAGAAQILFGSHADAFTGRHASLEDLWGRSTDRAREQLLEARSLADQLDVLERILAERLPHVRGLHPAVAQALEKFQDSPDVGEAVRQSGYSHRRFIVLFRRAVGLTPKVYCRMLRFQRTIHRMKAAPAVSWAGLALAAGFSDQAHFNREFREFTGVTPEEYRASCARLAFHVPVPAAGR